MTLVLDIETVPTRQATREQLEDMAEAAGVLTGATTDQDAVDRFASTTPALAEIACVGLLHVESGKRRAYVNSSLFYKTVEADEELYAAHTAGDALSTALAKIIALGPHAWPLVTFNGRAFDLPVMVMTLLRCDLPVPGWLSGMLYCNRYKWPSDHVDLREQLSFYGATKGTLRAFCVGLGIGDPKAEGDGANVGRLVSEGHWKELADYCLEDCRYEALLYQRWKGMR